MTRAFLFWILMLFWIIVAVVPVPAPSTERPYWRYFPYAGDLLLFVLLLLLGWSVYGEPIKH